MTADDKHREMLTQIHRDILLQLQLFIRQNRGAQPGFLEDVKTFLLNVVFTTISLTEVNHPGHAPRLYTEIEAAMKTNGLRAMAAFSANHGAVLYEAITIDETDKTSGMNYIGQQLVVTLFKSLGKLPNSMRNQDMVLRAIGTLLVNVLNQHHTHNAHQVLDGLCGQVHQLLNDLTERTLH